MNVADTLRESWQDYADLVYEWGIEEANASSFTIPCGSHRLVVEVPDGLSPTHYEFLGRVSVEAKPILAVGVLRNLVRTSVDWEHVLIQLYGLNIVEHLPSLVEKVGFPAVAEFVRAKVSEYRRKNPPPRMYLSVVRSPRWYAPMLCLGDMRWHFKEQNGPTQRLLAALEANDWRPWVQLPDLDPDQVRDAAKYLRRKTGTHLEWHAEADGRLQWMVRK